MTPSAPVWYTSGASNNTDTDTDTEDNDMNTVTTETPATYTTVAIVAQSDGLPRHWTITPPTGSPLTYSRVRTLRAIAELPVGLSTVAWRTGPLHNATAVGQIQVLSDGTVRAIPAPGHGLDAERVGPAAPTSSDGGRVASWPTTAGAATLAGLDADLVSGRRAPATAPAPAPAPGTVTTTGADETVSAVALARVTDDAAYLAAHGVALPPVVRVLGGRVNELGRSNFSASHAAWEGNPRTIDALEDVRATVRAERREDVTVDRAELRLAEDGRLTRGAGRLYLEESGLRGLVGLYSDTLPGAYPLLRALPPAERAELFDRQAGRTELTGPVRLRTRVVEGRRQVYAVVGTGYGQRDADVLAADMIDALSAVPGGREARGEVSYHAADAAVTASAIWHANHMVDLACGDVFRGGVRLESSDNGGGSIRVHTEWTRNLCYNLIILGKGTGPVARIVHRGTAQVATRLAAAMRTATSTASRFVARWTAARAMSAADALVALRGERAVSVDGAEVSLRELFASARTPEAMARVALGAVLELDHLDLPRRTDVSVELLLTGWRAEGGTSLADVINAVTRVHEARVPVELRTRYERAAGLLLPAA